MRAVHLLDDLIVISLRNDQTGVENACIEQVLHHIRLKRAENISGSKVDPAGSGFCRLRSLFPVKLRERVSLLLPLRAVLQSCFI